jgi:hypothetical protein
LANAQKRAVAAEENANRLHERVLQLESLLSDLQNQLSNQEDQSKSFEAEKAALQRQIQQIKQQSSVIVIYSLIILCREIQTLKKNFRKVFFCISVCSLIFFSTNYNSELRSQNSEISWCRKKRENGANGKEYNM